MRDTIIFFAILGIIVLLFSVICFWAIRAFFRMVIDILKKIFRKEESSYGGGVGVNVKELEESKQERLEIEKMRQPAVDVTPKKILEEKIEIKMPVPAEIKIPPPTEIKMPVPGQFNPREEKRDQEVAAKAQLGSQIKIPVAKNSPVQYQGGASALGPSSPVIEKSQISGIKHDSSLMFGEKGEVSRESLRGRLEGSRAYQAQREVGLSLSPTERANLERQVFSQALGGNISKTDLKWGLKKLNQKMATSKNLAEKEKMRKEIKFFKKIGGIK